MTDSKALTPRPPLPGGEGEESTGVSDLARGREHTEFDGSQGVIRNQWVSPVKLVKMASATGNRWFYCRFLLR